jgi:hypothetical protein
MKVLVLSITLLIAANLVSAQSQEKFYVGSGLGLDYGGFVGVKGEFIPNPHVGVCAGLGYNLLSVGWNVGANFKILPDKKVCPNALLMYGNNGVIVGTDDYTKARYQCTSYGITLGGGIDIKVTRKGHKISTYLFVPFRSSELRDKYDAMKNDSSVNSTTLLPIAFSVGFNFAL